MTSLLLHDGPMYLEKTLRYGLAHASRKLHSKFGPVLKNADRVLSRYAVNELNSADTMITRVYASPAECFVSE